jgi:hypothetical protein
MRARLAKAVRDSFAHTMQAELPQFVLLRSKPVPPGDSLYFWDLSCTNFSGNDLPGRLITTGFACH